LDYSHQGQDQTHDAHGCSLPIRILDKSKSADCRSKRTRATEAPALLKAIKPSDRIFPNVNCINGHGRFSGERRG